MKPRTPDMDPREEEPSKGEMALLAGNIDLESLPDLPSKTVRVYLSSTATDTVTERLCLTENVYPALRDICRQRHGLEFQVVDLRWGRSHEWADNSQDRMLYWRQIQQCQQRSAGPTFMTLVGQRYGHCPVASCIPELDFELITQALRNNRTRETRDVALLDSCYKKDDNCVPPVYRLQMHDRQHSAKLVMSAFAGRKRPLTWEETKTALRRLITKGVDYCIRNGSIDEADRLEYTMSDLEREIHQGIAVAPNSDSCFAYVRNITDLKNYLTSREAAKFLEIGRNEAGQPEVVPEMDSLRTNLVKRKIPEALKKRNQHEFNVLWKFDNGIDSEMHKEYLQSLCHMVEQDLLLGLKVDRQGKSSAQPSPLVEEVQQHWHCAKKRVSHFCREVRAEHLEVMRNYIISNSQRALVLHGPSGAGKSALISQAAAMVQDWLPGDSVVILRLLGITPASQDLRQLLHGISHQLTTVLGLDPAAVPVSYKELQSYLHNLLNSVPNEKTVAIFLDSLPDLLPSNNAHTLAWLPKNVPENVKIILSTVPETYGILNRLKEDIIADESHFLEVTALSSYDAMFVIDEWLSQDHRALTSTQRSTLEEAILKCSLLLYIRLIYEDTRQWTSFSDHSISPFPIDTPSFINSHFERLECQLGVKLVSRALAYLTASRTGLSDSEIEDILSLDDWVLSEVDVIRAEGIQRLPTSQWLRLKVSLDRYIVQKTCDDREVSIWDHKEALDVARQRYLSDAKLVREIHSNLADYFLGVWHGTKKPYLFPNKSVNPNPKHSADRLVPSQPLTFQRPDGTIHFNKRLFSQVPCHLCKSGRLDEFNDLVLFSYDWLYNKANALSLEHVLDDFALNPGVEATLVENALRHAQPYIAKNVNCLAAELTGRLLAYYHTHENIRKLISGCDRMGLSQSALIPNFPYHQVPGSPLRHTLDCQKCPQTFAIRGEDSRYLLAKHTGSRNVEVFDLVSGERHSDIRTSIGELYLTPDGNRMIILNTKTEKAIKLHDVNTGGFVGQFIPLNHIKLESKDLYRLGKMSLSNTRMCLTVTTDVSYLLMVDLDGCRLLAVRGLEGRASICYISPDGCYVFSNSNNNLVCYDLKSFEQVLNNPLDHPPHQLICRTDAQMAFLITSEENKLYVLHLRDGHLDLMYKVVLTQYYPDDSIDNLHLAKNQELLLIRGGHNLVVYHVGTERVLCHIERPAQLLREFKLPGKDYTSIDFTQATFSADSKFVLGAIFRHIYVWHAANGRPLTSLQAPVGLIQDMLVPMDRAQVISHLSGSNHINVWGLGNAIDHVGTPDRLTARVQKIIMAQDDKTAFIQCSKSDEIGVMDMRSGMIMDLLTHRQPVHSFSPTADGQHLFVATHSSRPTTANQIWYIKKRQIIYEFGDSPAFSIPMQMENTIISISQENGSFKAPYSVTLYSMHQETFDQVCVPHEIKFVLDEPFITLQDKYLVILTADDYNSECALHVNPSICAVSLKASLSVSTFGARELQDVVAIRRILHVRPIPNNSYTVLVLFTNEPDAICDSSRPPSRHYEHCYAFLIFDICSGVVCQVIDDFMVPSTPLSDVLFTQDVSLCVDHESNVFDMGTGYFLKMLRKDGLRPRHLALSGKVALFYEKDHIYAVRVSDGVEIARVHTHGTITCMQLGHEQRTLVAGCADGALVSYVLVDADHENVESILANVLSRHPTADDREKGCRTSELQCWDGGSPYSRPPSTQTIGPTDREALYKLRDVTRARPSSDTALYRRTFSSKTCIVM